MISDLVPHLGELADDICFLHSIKGKTNTHGPGENYMSTGFTLDGFPSMGAWTSYALGSENQDLPSYVAIPDPRGTPQASVNNWGPGFLPAAFQGTDFNAAQPIRNLDRPASIDAKTDRATRSFLQRLNEQHLARFPGDSELAARISSYELAARMQLSAPEALDISSEPKHILKMYGLSHGLKEFSKEINPVEETDYFGRKCLVARRLLERGVRFIQIWSGNDNGFPRRNWDSHEDIKRDHGPLAMGMSHGAAALIKDLKQRGMLEDTLVVWGGEFGRTPIAQGTNGRDHNPQGFTTWLAGGGVKPGMAYGNTDDYGYYAVENRVHMHDLHSTMLHLLGIDHKKLTYKYAGRDFRLTDIYGEVVHDILA